MAKSKIHADRWEYNWNAEGNGAYSSLPELVTLGYDRFHEASPLYDHNHERCYEFVFVEKGKVTWEVDEHIYPSNTGQCFHTRPGEWHRARLNYIEPCSIWWVIIVDPAEQPGWLSFGDDERQQLAACLRQLPRIINVDSRMRDQFEALRSLVSDELPAPLFRVRHHLADIVLQLLYPRAERQIQSELRDAMLALTGLIEAEPERRWANKELADIAGVSESHFYRLFHALHGQSPANYIDRLRMNRACELLREPRSNVTDVAMDLGYKTSQHFATVFKKYIGVSPSQWKKTT
ncbi:AraC family transcriptional regulator [Paenibacillus sp. OV219]|uniref:helix-turn-helix transcriptional regulator n=1 Tax=Paenibacillus sp. OV219 TaxID=1884377 RepID=UPI0008C2A342|nr:AraC family transcriptional regulator [Paenibacillus sp. OV219]SEM58422.1 AraC-type DNA-binding protein [Paenibacillus sp. OV219]